MSTTMNTTRRIGTCLFLLSVVIAGCNRDVDTNEEILQKQFENPFGQKMTPVQAAAMIFDQKDPDTRRAGIEWLSHKDWALKDPYLKRFASLTDPKVEPDAAVRSVAVRVLGKAGNTAYQPQINAALDDPDSSVRWDAAIVLATMPSDKVIIRLQAIVLHDESIDARSAAAAALARYKNDDAYRTLLQALADDEFIVRSAAHDALVTMTGVDHGYDPAGWVPDRSKVDLNHMPPPVVRHRKRPWWDWMRTTKEVEVIQPVEPK
jgi:HEAT repeat protein